MNERSTYHLYLFLKASLGNPKSEPIVLPYTKYIIPSIDIITFI